MKNIHFSIVKKIVLIMTFVALSLKAYASDENHTLTMHLTNTTHEQLHFDRVASSKPGNSFSIDTKTINPGETATITGIKSTNNDLEAYLIFTNNNGDTGILHVLDQEQIHFGQPIFNFSGAKFSSSLISKTRNKNIGPRFLTYIAADMQVISGSST